MMLVQARPSRQHSTARPLPGIARLADALGVFLGLGALFGGDAFILGPDGHMLGMPTSLLAGQSVWGRSSC